MKEYTEPYATPYYDGLKANGIRLPAVLCQIRTDEGREMRRGGVEVFKYKFLTPRTDRISNTLTGVTKDNLIMTKTNIAMELTYHEHPTKEDLLEYFGQRIRVRKMTEREALRIMGLREQTIDRIMNAEIRTTLKDGTVKVKRMPKTQIYKQAGNGIVPQCVYHLARTLFIPNQPENRPKPQPTQKSLFDI